MLNDDVMYHHVIQMLKTDLPPYCHYHNYEHTLYVWHKVAEIGAFENRTPAEIAILKVAALWHDTGFLNDYHAHEEESCRLATDWLTTNNYPVTFIEQVCGMIMATKLPQTPKNKLEEILADADLEYLGTGYAGLIAASLFKELQEFTPSLSRREWDELQVSYIQQHHYFTRYCKENKEPLKQVYLQELMRQL